MPLHPNSFIGVAEVIHILEEQERVQIKVSFLKTVRGSLPYPQFAWILYSWHLTECHHLSGQCFQMYFKVGEPEK